MPYWVGYVDEEGTTLCGEKTLPKHQIRFKHVNPH